MPIASVASGQCPRNATERQTALHDRVVGDVRRVVIVHVTLYRRTAAYATSVRPANSKAINASCRPISCRSITGRGFQEDRLRFVEREGFASRVDLVRTPVSPDRWSVPSPARDAGRESCVSLTESHERFCPITRNQPRIARIPRIVSAKTSSSFLSISVIRCARPSLAVLVI